MNFLKPILIAVIVILTVLIIVKANSFATSDQPSGKQKPEKDSPAPPHPEPPMQTPIEFFIVYVGRRVPVTHYPFTIGSRNDNDLIITDSTVSRQHAELFRKQIEIVEGLAAILTFVIISIRSGTVDKQYKTFDQPTAGR